MKEIEVKFKVSDLAPVKREVKKLGGRLLWRGREENFYFDFPGRPLKRAGLALRLRRWPGQSSSLTLKIGGRRADRKYKIREEKQILVNDFTIAKRLLVGLGLKPFLHYRKLREHWQVGKNLIDLDQLNSRASFVEIEGAKQGIDRLAKKLNLDWRQATAASYVEILTKRRRG